MIPYIQKDYAYQAELDRAADRDYLRDTAELTAEDVVESLAGATDAQFMQFCELLASTGDAEIKHMVRLICAKVIEKKVDEVVK